MGWLVLVTEFEKEIGKRIRTLREDMNISRETLSETANISPKFLYEIECGKKGLSALTLYEISKALNVCPDYLYNGETARGDSSGLVAMLETLDREKTKQLEQLIRFVIQMMR